MRLEHPHGYLDYDLDLFWDVVEPLNARLQRITGNHDTDVADMFDYANTAEQLVGVALAAAQVYFVTVSRHHGVSKERALDLGPMHPTGHSVARLINHGANFWKHADEWDWGSPTDHAKRILDVFRDLDMPGPDFSLVWLVSSLTGSTTANLESLRSVLEQWRTSVEKALSNDAHGPT